MYSQIKYCSYALFGKTQQVPNHFKFANQILAKTAQLKKRWFKTLIHIPKKTLFDPHPPKQAKSPILKTSWVVKLSSVGSLLFPILHAHKHTLRETFLFQVIFWITWSLSDSLWHKTWYTPFIEYRLFFKDVNIKNHKHFPAMKCWYII